MATTAPEIRVFAEFPLDPENYSGRWNWVHCLTFPIDTVNNLHFTQRPYKWIRYATGVVVGAEGHLSLNRDLPDDVMDYNGDHLSEPADLYYHTSDIEKQRMFPTDPDMGREGVTSFNPTARRVRFRDDVLARDRTCVLTDIPSFFCDAVHLLPHAKEDEYIKTYTRRRGRASNDNVENIDDIRNGALLNNFSHRALGRLIAFLVTPNFAMSTSDVDPTAPPQCERCTVHLFDPDQPASLGNPALSSGAQVRIPDSTSQWPPSIIFDSVYASAVLAHFSPQTIKDTLKSWKPIFYPRRITSAAQASHQTIKDEAAAQNKKREAQNKSRDERAAKRAEREGHEDDRGDYLDYLMMMPYILMDPKKVQATWREAAEKKAGKERKNLDDKVMSWADEVANASL